MNKIAYIYDDDAGVKILTDSQRAKARVLARENELADVAAHAKKEQRREDFRLMAIALLAEAMVWGVVLLTLAGVR